MYFGAHNHTDWTNAYANKDSIITVEKLINKSVELGLKGVAITEHGIISSHFNAIEYVKKGKEKGTIPNDFKLGLGLEAYVVPREEVENAVKNNEKARFYHLIIIAKDKIGHKAITELSSRGFENSFTYRGAFRVPIYYDDLIDIASKYKDHLIVSSACIGGALGHYGLKYIQSQSTEDKQKVVDFLNLMYKLFGKSFYIEIQPSHQEEQIAFNKLALNIAKATGIKTIVTTDSHYTDLSEQKAHEVFLKSSETEREVFSFYSSTYLMGSNEIKNYLIDYMEEDKIQELLDNTLEIYDSIEEYSLKSETVVPDADIPDNFEIKHLFCVHYEKYPFIKKFAYSNYIVDKYFLSLVEQGFIDRKQEMNDTTLSRINIELEQIWGISENLNLRLSNYYCVVLDIINEAFKTSLYGCGRGSAGAFYLLYLIGIVLLNPLEHNNLPFYRHISIERPELPDCDLDFQSSQKDNIIELLANKYSRERVLSICTFKTNGSRETILGAFRGLGLSDNKAHYIASLLGSEKGGNWSIRDSYFGNEEKGRKPVTAFVNAVDEYKELDLLNILLSLEGLIIGRSSHAAATLIFNNNYNEDGVGMMKTASGQWTTQYEMRNCEAMGQTKMDCLVISCLDRIRVCMDMLIADGLMEWKGSLKETFYHYLHPDVLEMEAPEMFDMLYNGECISAFQFEAMQGQKALSVVKPRSFTELSACNNLMRITVENGEQPLDKYVRFKNDISEWYKEMREEGLNDDEIKILEKYLLPLYGIADSQEVIMFLSQDKDIAGFSLKEANKLRKSVGKKRQDLLDEVKELFFRKGHEIGTRDELLNYIWKYCIYPMKNYAFSNPHTAAYTMNLMIELNLCYKFGSAYWKAACLTVDSGITETDKKGTIDYGKIAEAVGNMRNDILAPNINQSKAGFSVKDNKVLYGLVGINGVNENEAQEIINKRPFVSFDDFIERCEVSNKAIISLIKCGAFDSIEADRKALAMKYTKHTTQLLKSLTTVQAQSIVDNGLLPQELQKYVEFNFIRKEVLSKKNLFKMINKTNGYYYLSEESLNKIKLLGFNVEFTFNDDGRMIVEKTKLQNAFKKQTEPLNAFLKSEEALVTYNRMLLNKEWIKKFFGDLLDWEMDSIRTYIGTEHGMDKYDLSYLPIKNFSELEEGKKIDDFKYELQLIAGTVISSDKDKHTLGILTKDGVVKIKMSKQAFAQYNQIDSVKEGKTKTILSDTWFKAGTHLIIQGFKQGEIFMAKGYKSSTYPIFIKVLGKNKEGKTIFNFEK